LLSPEEAGKYERGLSLVTVQVFEDSDHEIWKPDRGRYLGALRGFLKKIDLQVTGRTGKPAHDMP